MLGNHSSGKSNPRVLIVDDDDAIMRAVARVLDLDESIDIVGQTTHAQAAIPMAEVLCPDVVLMDIHMLGLDPFQACEQILESTGGRTKVLFYTGFPRDTYLDRCLAVGAAGVVSKHTESLKNLGYAIRHVAKGNTYFSPELDRRLVEREQGQPTSKLATLNQRERDVLRELALGKTQGAIATQLDLSERTVNTVVGSVKEKLELTSLNDLVIFAVNEGLIYPELQYATARVQPLSPGTSP